jgi:threonine dehydrogenase-like Zn-dependent dehydrogenase
MIAKTPCTHGMMGGTMMQAILYGAGDLRMEERALDPSTLAADEVYVETEVTALSTGTDLGNYLGRSTDVPGAPDYPRGAGYSNVGVVRGTGTAVRTISPGTRVFSMKPHLSAFIAKEAELMVPVPDGVEPEQASLAYLTQLGVAALRQAHYEAGERVVVVGLGVIGLGTCGMARAMGAHVIAVANSPVRAGAALRAGAHEAVVCGRDPLPTNVPLVILTANPWQAYLDSVEMAGYGGRISVLGFPGRGEPPPEFNPLAPKWFYGKQLTLIGAGFAPRTECPPSDVRFNLRRNLEYILASMASGALNLNSAISHRFAAPDMRDAYELAKAHDKSLMAAVFDWRSK